MKRLQKKLHFLAITSLLLLPSCMNSDNECTNCKTAPLSETDEERAEMAALTRNNSEEKDIKLFVYSRCPYCHKVIEFLKSIGHLDDVTILDAGNSANMTRLKQLNHGNTQCPFLRHDSANVSMLESADIIAYLKKYFKA